MKEFITVLRFYWFLPKVYFSTCHAILWSLGLCEHLNVVNTIDRWFKVHRYCEFLWVVFAVLRSCKTMATAEGFLQSPLVVWVRRILLSSNFTVSLCVQCLQIVWRWSMQVAFSDDNFTSRDRKTLFCLKIFSHLCRRTTLSKEVLS